MALQHQPFPVPESQAKEKLAGYVYEYLVHIGASKTAETFKNEVLAGQYNVVNRAVNPGEAPGFLINWWVVFWDLYCASPERRDMNQSSQEAKAFHEYGFIPNPTQMPPVPQPGMMPNGMPGQQNVQQPFPSPSPGSIGMPPGGPGMFPRPNPPSSAPSPRFPPGMPVQRPPYGQPGMPDGQNGMYPPPQNRFPQGPGIPPGPPGSMPPNFNGGRPLNPAQAAAQMRFGASPNQFMGSPAGTPFGQNNSPAPSPMMPPAPSPRNMDPSQQMGPDGRFIMPGSNGAMQPMMNDMVSNGGATPTTPSYPQHNIINASQNQPIQHQMNDMNPSSNQMPMMQTNDPVNEIKQSPAQNNMSGGPASVGATSMQNPPSVHSQGGPRSVASMSGANDGSQISNTGGNSATDSEEISKIKNSLFEDMPANMDGVTKQEGDFFQ
uniref:LisH domain-containing protein n=1 Tax=Strongyloides papillosus TaxID=174720 RepID=A0A0N5BR90_STREA